MDSFPSGPSPPDGGLAAARVQIESLIAHGIPREMLLRALLEDHQTSQDDTTSPISMAAGLLTDPNQSQFQQQQQQQQQSQQQPPPPKAEMNRSAYNARLSVSTTSSRSSGRESVASMATTLSSVSSQDMAAMSPSQRPMPTTKSNNRGTSKPQGPYWCTFCDVAFQRKFDWKRHEDEFHERYKSYPCPECNRIFQGANTFNQHHKNAHGCTSCPHADRVVQYTMRKQAWACGFCGGFCANRDRYFDHVARHYEDGCNKTHWNHSLVIYGLLHQPSINDARKEFMAARFGNLPRDQQPVLEWDIKLTGHAQGFMEGKSPGKLQDLLEFFDPQREDPRFLASLALDSAIQRPRATVGELPATPASRRVSEPPKAAKPMPASSRHLSTPQAHLDDALAPFRLKQQPVAAASSFSNAQLLAAAQQLHAQQQQIPQLVQQQQQHAPKQHNNPFLASYTQTFMETPETGHAFMLSGTSLVQTAPHLAMHHTSPLSAQQQQQQQQHMNSITTIAEMPWQDWSSMSSATLLDDGASAYLSDAWPGSPPLGPGAGAGATG